MNDEPYNNQDDETEAKLPRTFGGTVIFILFILAILLVGSALVGMGFGWGLLFVGAL